MKLQHPVLYVNCTSMWTVDSTNYVVVNRCRVLDLLIIFSHIQCGLALLCLVGGWYQLG